MTTLTDQERGKIWKKLAVGDGKNAVLLHYPDIGQECSSDEVNRNVVCLDSNDNLLWRIKPPKPSLASGDPFVHIEHTGEALCATRFSGDICEIDLGSGFATKIDWTK